MVFEAFEGKALREVWVREGCRGRVYGDGGLSIMHGLREEGGVVRGVMVGIMGGE